MTGVQESLSSYESKIIFRGQLVSVLAGEHEHDLVVVIEFPDLSTLNDRYYSEKYQLLIALRDKARMLSLQPMKHSIFTSTP